MGKFLTVFMRILFAGILGTATILTTVIMSPLLLLMWLWKKLGGTPPRK